VQARLYAVRCRPCCGSADVEMRERRYMRRESSRLGASKIVTVGDVLFVAAGAGSGRHILFASLDRMG
jgi:hypothetical protein